MSKFTDTMKGLFSGKTGFSKTVSVVAIIAIIAVIIAVVGG